MLSTVTLLYPIKGSAASGPSAIRSDSIQHIELTYLCVVPFPSFGNAQGAALAASLTLAMSCATVELAHPRSRRKSLDTGHDS